MTQISRLAFLCIALFGATFISSCADKMTDQHSAMVGGDQSIGRPGVTDLKNNGTPLNTDGKGQPIAGGKVNSKPDTMWNQSAPASGKPF